MTVAFVLRIIAILLFVVVAVMPELPSMRLCALAWAFFAASFVVG